MSGKAEHEALKDRCVKRIYGISRPFILSDADRVAIVDAILAEVGMDLVEAERAACEKIARQYLRVRGENTYRPKVWIEIADEIAARKIGGDK